MDTIVYRINDSLYVNLTNRCSNNCSFCVRNSHEGVEGYYLWLEKEPTAEDIIAELKQKDDYKQVVFCGFGEPLYKLDVIIEVAKKVKALGKKTRINTNGQAGLIAGSNVAKKIHGLIDTVNISLNSTDSAKYFELCKPEFGECAYYDLLKFAKECVKEGINTVLSVVDIIGEEEIAKAQKIALDIGATLRVRKNIE